MCMFRHTNVAEHTQKLVYILIHVVPENIPVSGSTHGNMPGMLEMAMLDIPEVDTSEVSMEVGMGVAIHVIYFRSTFVDPLSSLICGTSAACLR